MRLILFLAIATNLFAQRGEDGLTYVQRRQQWLKSVPHPTQNLSDEKKRLYFSAWLQKGIYNATVSDALHSILGNFWKTGGRSHHGYMVGLIVKYGSKGLGLIDPNDEMAVRNRYEDDLILKAGVFEDVNPNKQLWAMAGIYLYAHYFNRDIQFPVYGHRLSVQATDMLRAKQNWPSFSYGGRTYLFGNGPFNAKQLAEDYIKHKLQVWILAGNRELDSLNYHRAFVGSMLLIYDMAQDNDFKTRARMGAELAMLDAIMDFGGSEWGGTLGRTDFGRIGKESVFPFYEYFGLSEENGSRPDIKVLYTFDYEPPALLVDLAVLTDENDDYYHFHREHHASGLKNDSGKGKWNYVTRFYNLGSNVGGHNSGWQAAIRGSRPGTFIRLWINDTENFGDKTETRYLGSEGRQFRNALFAKIGGRPVIHERKKDQAWDNEDFESGWRFKRLDKVFVAIGIAETAASVEMAIQGVDYSSYRAFKSAVKSHAFLSETSYTTSKGVTIDNNDECGLDRPDDCSFPFKRMETSYAGGKMIRWANDVMTVHYHGRTLTYDFKNWQTDMPPTTDTPPTRPTNVQVKATN